MAERATSCEHYFATLQDRFIADAAKGVNATIFFDLKGDDGGEWTVTVADGTCEVATGKAVEKPTVTIKMKPAHFIDMSNGDLDGTKAFMTRKLKVSGSIPMAQKMKAFLPPLEK